MTPDELEQKIQAANPAFPVQYSIENRVVGSFGMTLRDYFAAAALTGIASRPNSIPDADAELAYEYADAMLAARKEKP